MARLALVLITGAHSLTLAADVPAVPAEPPVAAAGSLVAGVPPVVPAYVHPAHNRNTQACLNLAPQPWPTTPVARRAAIHHLQNQRRECIGSPAYLAALGALLLEDGKAEEALLWLERSLLLDPDDLGAQADHALALDRLGEPVALRELARSWSGRADLPPSLRDKLFPPSRGSLYALPVVRLGLPERRRLGFQAESNLLAGYESNLDRSPRLTELTLTIPEGPLSLPVISTPRKGFAVLGSASAQVAYAPWPATVLRTGLNINARSAPSEAGTDWRQVQFAAEALQHGEGWVAQVDATAAWIGGPLNEAYSVTRVGISGEASVLSCRARLALVREQRVQSETVSLNAAVNLTAVDLSCPVPGLAGWDGSLSVSGGRDRPEGPDRPGGDQTLRGLGLRLAGPVNAYTRLDLSWRSSRVDDSDGYSVLLEDNAVRRLSLNLVSLQLTHSLDRWGLPGLSANLQWQAARQFSNLKLFAYRADSVYGGIRWTW